MGLVTPSVEIAAADKFKHCTRSLKCGPAYRKESIILLMCADA